MKKRGRAQNQSVQIVQPMRERQEQVQDLHSWEEFISKKGVLGEDRRQVQVLRFLIMCSVRGDILVCVTEGKRDREEDGIQRVRK